MTAHTGEESAGSEFRGCEVERFWSVAGVAVIRFVRQQDAVMACTSEFLVSRIRATFESAGCVHHVVAPTVGLPVSFEPVEEVGSGEYRLSEVFGLPGFSGLSSDLGNNERVTTSFRHRLRPLKSRPEN